MATAQSVIRQVQALCGDPSGRKVSAEMIVDIINEEAARILARFPSEIEIITAQEETEPTYAITSADIVPTRHTITKVYLNQSVARMMSSDEMERITHEL